MFFILKKKEKTYPAYASKDNSNHRKQVILLMIRNAEGRHCLLVKNYQRY